MRLDVRESFSTARRTDGLRAITIRDTSGNPHPNAPIALPMVALYSIAGVIAAFVLTVVLISAVRAYQQPDLYGPRAGRNGLPEQSRTQGLARAVLDSLPIVKFKQRNGLVDKQTSTELGQSSKTPPPAEDQSMGCSICTEDFDPGQDIRILPCNHTFHPACIDPWLTTVSGTCPLCRIDLRRTLSASGDSKNPSDQGNGAADRAIEPNTFNNRAASGPLTLSDIRNSRTSRDEIRLEGASEMEHSQGSRSDAAVNNTNVPLASEQDTTDARHRRWLATHFREIFHIRTRHGVNPNQTNAISAAELGRRNAANERRNQNPLEPAPYLTW